MIFSRRGRLEEIRQRKRLIFAITGSLGLIILLAVFGFKILIGFSLFMDGVKGTPTQENQNTKRTIFPPVLDPLPIATKSGALRISGSGEANLTIAIYVDSVEVKKTIIAGNGNFFVTISPLKDGNHTVQAMVTDSKGNKSDLTNPVKLVIKSSPPILEVHSPEDKAVISGESNIVKITGNTEEETSVTVNGRFVVVHADNSFSYDYPLSEGEQSLIIEAKDQALNTTKTERKVTYQK